ncbi:MAG: preprotein translocase subunit YajC [Desulfobulbaceae bacterium BRH_c16a]|nr:MAG: preprotein translocase subunit YajC [Desulfobulbaceae bacterium BRH_c16a]
MDTYRAFLAIIISFVILLGYQYFFVGMNPPATVTETVQPQQGQQAQTAVPAEPARPEAVAQPSAGASLPAVSYDREPKNITIDTDLYTAILSEDGGTIRSFVLKNHKETNAENSPGMQLVKTDATQGFPLQFSWGTAVTPQVLYSTDKEKLRLSHDKASAELRMVGQAANGLTVERVYGFNNDSYLIDVSIKVRNSAENLLQGIPQLELVNVRFEGVASPADNFLFAGPVAYINGELQEIDSDDFKDGPTTLQGNIEWAGFEGNYFLCGIVPLEGAGASFTARGTENLANTHLAGTLDTLQPGTEKEYKYHVFYGPKKLDMLKNIGYNLDKSVNFGWFDVIAKPTLWLLNLFYEYCRNYGVAIILVTVLFKAAFWPISQKGLKSMKNMQKLQPKMVKIKEKYKNDPTRMNQEVMSLYKTYKVNPLGGCLPMVLQIPVFFALYKVLLQSIELRHAPFMLWISDLSAPDRLWLGFDIPYLGGLPVLTLLMGASMFFQQKLSPTTADPTQAKIMMFLPVIFTFMFLNFASGLVLYWFINNLLSILQQVLINRETKKPEAAQA